MLFSTDAGCTVPGALLHIAATSWSWRVTDTNPDDAIVTAVDFDDSQFLHLSRDDVRHAHGL